MSTPQVHTLSCVHCRQRKVKCTKTYPCPQCAKIGLECVFPSRKKDRAPRRNKNHELLNRLAKLEAIVGQVDPNAVGGSAASRGVTAAAASAPVPTAVFPPITPAQQWESELRNPQKRCPNAQPVSKDDPVAKYVSGEFWANLCREVEGIKAALDQPSDREEEEDDDDDDGSGDDTHDGTSPESYESSPSAYMSSSAILGNTGNTNVTEGSLLRHPPPERMKQLRDIYFHNVDTLLKILHQPTISEIFDLFIVNPEDNPLSRTKEALLFAMYFAAVTSLTPEHCRTRLGEDRGVLVARYKQAVELALARADYLNSSSLESLQAVILYDTCIRNQAQSRASWALLGLVVRLAQAIGLHRDGNGTPFPPFEAEMRRRAWAQIIVLDVRAAQDRGTEPIVRQEDYNTISPTNINDADFGPSTTVPIPQLARDGPTDITFGLCTYECSILFLYVHGPRAKFFSTESNATESLSQVQSHVSEEDVIQRIKALETRFVTPAASYPDHYPTVFAAAVVRLASLIFWLTIQYPFQVRQPTIKPRVSREHMLQTAIAIINLQTLGPGGGFSAVDYADRCMWWQDGYVQWHPLSVALAELCVQTEGPLVERAWRTVDRVLPLWRNKVADQKGGALWRPIRKLARRAREKRAEAQMRTLMISNEGGEQSQTRESPASAQQQGQAQKTIAATTMTQPHSKSRASPQPSPLAAATSVGPTGIPVNTDFSDIDLTSMARTGSVPEDVLASPSALLFPNTHDQWTIDFGGDNMMEDVPMQDFDTMDWSVWNDFVNDANVNVDDGTSHSSEYK